MKSAITITAWRRPDFLKRSLDSLASANGIENHKIFVTIDGGYPEMIEQMYGICFKHKLGKQIEINSSHANLGCAGNMYINLVLAFAEADFVMHLDDDVIVMPDYINYMTWAAEKYESDPTVFSINAFNRCEEHEYREHMLGMVSRRKIFTSFAWGMFKSRWREFDLDFFGIHWRHGVDRKYDVSFTQAKNSPPEGDAFYECIIKSDTGSYSWPIEKLRRKGRYEIYPLISRVQNIGYDNRGTFSLGGDFHMDKHYAPVVSENYSGEYKEV